MICPNNWHHNGSYNAKASATTGAVDDIYVHGYGDYTISELYLAYNVLANVLTNGTNTM